MLMQAPRNLLIDLVLILYCLVRRVINVRVKSDFHVGAHKRVLGRLIWISMREVHSLNPNAHENLFHTACTLVVMCALF